MNIFKLRPVPLGPVPILLAPAIILITALSFCYKTEERAELKMGTFVRIKLCGFRWHSFDTAFNKAFDIIDKVDSIADIYDKDSELSMLNRDGHINPVIVSDGLFLLIKKSVELSKASDGNFDITVWPLVKLWKNSRDKKNIPSQKEIKETLLLVGYDKIILEEADKSVSFSKKGVAIDLSAIAKGYAVDSAISVLKDYGFTSAVVDAGGDIYCLGRKNLLGKWRVGIVNPKDKKSIIKILYLADEAAATSGGYEQHFSYNGKEYGHLIDPKTGYAKEYVFSSVTVISKNCMLADGIATAVSVGGEEVKAKLEELYPDIEVIVKN